VVEAVPAQGTDHPLAERIGRWRARWCGEESGAESSDAAVEVGAIDRIAVVDEKSGDLLGPFELPGPVSILARRCSFGSTAAAGFLSSRYPTADRRCAGGKSLTLTGERERAYRSARC
jgi:hypothetical protein